MPASAGEPQQGYPGIRDKTKRRLPDRAWEPERVQLCPQGLVLEENGYSCGEGVLYFDGSMIASCSPSATADGPI